MDIGNHGPDRGRRSVRLSPLHRRAGALLALALSLLVDTRPGAQMVFDPAEAEPVNRGGFTYGSAWFFPRSGSDAEDDIGVFHQELRISAPILRGADSLSVSATMAALDYDADTAFPESGTVFPGAVSDIGFGVRYAHLFGSGTVVGGSLNVGSAGEELFGSTQEPYLVGVAFTRIPSGERDAWRLFAVFATKSGSRFPLLLPSYGWQAAETLRVDIGLPLGMRWRPVRSVLIDASYIPLTRVHFQAKWKPALGPLAFSSSFDWTYRRFLFESVQGEEERMSTLAKVASLGMEYSLKKHTTFELGTSYSFDRVFVLSEDPREDDRIEGAPGFSVSAGIRVKL